MWPMLIGRRAKELRLLWAALPRSIKPMRERKTRLGAGDQFNCARRGQGERGHRLRRASACKLSDI